VGCVGDDPVTGQLDMASPKTLVKTLLQDEQLVSDIFENALLHTLGFGKACCRCCIWGSCPKSTEDRRDFRTPPLMGWNVEPTDAEKAIRNTR